MERLNKFVFTESKLGEPDIAYGYYFHASFEKRLKDTLSLIEFAFQQPDFVNIKLDKTFCKARKRDASTK